MTFQRRNTPLIRSSINYANINAEVESVHFLQAYLLSSPQSPKDDKSCQACTVLGAVSFTGVANLPGNPRSRTGARLPRTPGTTHFQTFHRNLLVLPIQRSISTQWFFYSFALSDKLSSLRNSGDKLQREKC